MPKLIYEGKEYQVTGELVMGRHRDNPLCLSDGRASRHHASVALRGDGSVWVKDLDSANGTKVNGEALVTPRRLMHGDRIVIGKSTVSFLGDGHAGSPPAEDRTSVTNFPTKAIGPSSALEPRNPTGALPIQTKLIGSVLGSCRLLSVLRIGSLATVYRTSPAPKDPGSRESGSGNELVVKVFHGEVTARVPDFANRLREGARIAKRIHHPAIISARDCDEYQGLAWYSMDLVEGHTLEDLLARQGTIDVASALSYIEQVASAMQAAHAKDVLHGDISPENILIDSHGSAHLLDLGLVDLLSSARTAGRPGTAPDGNPWYMSPEKVVGETVDKRSDIYSLGCVLFHLLTGEPPFDEDGTEAIRKAHAEKPIPTVSGHIPGLASKVEDLVQSMLSKNPEWRYATMTEVIADVAVARAAQPASRTNSKMMAATPARVLTNPSAQSPSPPSTSATIPLTSPVFQAAADRAQDRLTRSRSHRQSAIWVTGITCIALVVIWWLVMGSPHPGVTGFHLDQGSVLDTSVQPPIARNPPSTASPHPGGSIPQPGAGEGGGTSGTSGGGSDLANRWREVQVQVDQDAKSNSWGAAEMALQAFADEVKQHPADASLLGLVQIKQDQLNLDGGAWFRSMQASLPRELGPRLMHLSDIRDVAMSGERAEAEALYQETLNRLLQILQTTRRQARQQIEMGHVGQLNRFAADIAPDFAGTPVEGLQHQFAAVAREASAVSWQWRGDWLASREQLLHATGANALAAAAILLLTDDPVAAKTLVMAQAALNNGELLARRERLFGREVAILSFTKINDLQYIEDLANTPKLDTKIGALYGPAGEALGLACTVPVGGENWEVALTLSMHDVAGKAAQAVISCVKNGQAEFQLVIDHDDMHCSAHLDAGMKVEQFPRPADEPLQLRIRCRANRLEVREGKAMAVLCGFNATRIAPGCQVRFEIADAIWQLRRLQVVGSD